MLRVCFPVRVNGVMNSEVCLHLVKERSGILLPGEVSERHFWLLIEISGMHSEKVI
ncbi:PapB/FocB family fimbrial expression transcriptional regulator, partial [Escherichia coli]